MFAGAAMDALEYFRHLEARRATIVADSADALALARARGFTAAAYTPAALARPDDPPALVLATRMATFDALVDGWEAATSTFTHLAVARHDPGALADCLDELLAIDARAALERRAAMYDLLLSCDELELTGPGGAAALALGAELEIANAGAEVNPCWLYAVSEFFEASVVNLEHARSSFTVDGRFGFAGLAHLSNDEALGAATGERLARLLRRAAGADNWLELADNRVVRFVVAGEDATAEFAALLAGAERGAAITELGLGCARFTPPWTSNTPLHKCAGVWLGVGNGADAPHIDFIAPDASVRPLRRAGA